MDAPTDDANGGDEEECHPALILWDALNRLHSVCWHAGDFQKLAERRRGYGEVRASVVRLYGEATAEPANERIRKGEHPFDVLAEYSNQLPTTPPDNEPPEYIESLRDVLARGLKLCGDARETLRAGGADVLDAHVAPSRSIDITKKVMEAETVFLKLDLEVQDPSSLIDDDAKAMGVLADFFEQQRTELSAVLEVRGLSLRAAGDNSSATQDAAGSKPNTGAERTVTGLWQGDPWKDPARSVDEKVRFYMAKLSTLGKSERPACREVAEAIDASPGGVTETDAWEAWGKVGQLGIAADRVDPGQHQQSKRTAAQRIRQDEDDRD